MNVQEKLKLAKENNFLKRLMRIYVLLISNCMSKVVVDNNITVIFFMNPFLFWYKLGVHIIIIIVWRRMTYFGRIFREDFQRSHRNFQYHTDIYLEGRLRLRLSNFEKVIECIVPVKAWLVSLKHSKS